MPARWLMDLSDAISGNRGYLAVGTVLAAYLAAFGLIDTKSTQEETRASVERSLFITLVSSGNAASFVAAMKDFGSTQRMLATQHPSLLKFWEWGRTYQPNQEPMWHWAAWRLKWCSKQTKDCSLTNNTRLDLSGTGLYDTLLSVVDLRGADLRDAFLIRANLTGANLHGANLTGAVLDFANLQDADLTSANLSNADLSDAHLNRAKFSPDTKFPPHFDPKAAGMVLTAN